MKAFSLLGSSSNILYVVFLNQVGVYMGKRDFVDRVDSVDPVGMWENRHNFINLPVILSTYCIKFS